MIARIRRDETQASRSETRRPVSVCERLLCMTIITRKRAAGRGKYSRIGIGIDADSGTSMRSADNDA